MAEDHDTDILEPEEFDSEVRETLSHKDQQKLQLDMRRRLEERLERRRLQDQLGCDDLRELDYL
ncbi:hypothetical protein QWI17_05370 [Gilvimarinus sp. SDUM040013]|uniref:Uncharacterized protein n=1 Tax=Gilvimarinus gilvus TaxID=3058038 RepID=A0ABU4RWI7_9GAMM|nr:hypothetical protein [Gilvimarinus sp. SDUM040013]MDO3385267.1 hypothetical protein [Gilvimarinus sp. SDUM040013]MDX6849250.1 hypothetical protein [Gilvimarinus sp. SDUM040013]